MMGSGQLFVNRIIHIFTTNSGSNIVNRVLLCGRTSVRINSHSVVFTGLTEHDTSGSDDDFCDFDYLQERGREFNKRATVSMLQDLFSCSVKEIEAMVKKCPGLKYVSAKNAQSSIQFFKAKGVTEDILHQNLWLLKYKTGDQDFCTSVIL
jgi:hypothetical protein